MNLELVILVVIYCITVLKISNRMYSFPVSINISGSKIAEAASRKPQF